MYDCYSVNKDCCFWCSVKTHLIKEAFVGRDILKNFICAFQIKLVEPNINSDSPSHRRASFVTLAVAVEGCADYIKNR